MTDEADEPKIFEILSTAIEKIDGDMEATDLVSVLMRLAAIVISQAPNTDTREAITSMGVHCLHLYIGECVGNEGGSLTRSEARNSEMAKKFFLDETDTGGTLQ